MLYFSFLVYRDGFITVLPDNLTREDVSGTLLGFSGKPELFINNCIVWRKSAYNCTVGKERTKESGEED